MTNMIYYLFFRLIFPLLLSIFAYADVVTYRALVTRFDSSPFQGLIAGSVVIFAESETLSLGYAGNAYLDDEYLVYKACNGTNGCGVHIHNGTSCNDTTTQGGHYYSGDVTEDPWVDERYSISTDGSATFQGVVNIGTIDIQGRVFVMHSGNGTRIGCGVLEAVNDDFTITPNLFNTTTVGLAGGEVASTVNIYANDAVVCYFGSAINLEPNLISYLSTDSAVGTDCNFTNGCGVHIHNGTSCADKASQGGHLYDAEEVSEDPWLSTMYHSTNDKGDAQFVGCVQTGLTGSYANYPFIVHSNNGSRVSCGILKALNNSSLDSSAATTQFVMSVMAVVSAIVTTAWTVLSFV